MDEMGGFYTAKFVGWLDLLRTGIGWKFDVSRSLELKCFCTRVQNVVREYGMNSAGCTKVYF